MAYTISSEALNVGPDNIESFIGMKDVSDPCETCPNRPRNGEMKACNCTLGGIKVTC